ncbi:MAG: FKBP-type peptidyl-prolyl cis-trans isomerase [Betaproteobacteria bacterium]|nr:FKBP-type peptidyl-prolyl cis-trans isomerase [Betaproteobacteria bacterium]
MSAVRTAGPGDTLTLHYRLRTAAGVEISSTFGDAPVTVTLGAHDMAPPLETRLAGLVAGDHRIFELPAVEGFGLYNPDLVKEMALADFPPGMTVARGQLLEFTLPNEVTLSGTVENVTWNSAVVDFNHPLAGCDVVLEVAIVAIGE